MLKGSPGGLARRARFTSAILNRRAVRRALASWFLSLLLFATAWGGCISCEQFFTSCGHKNCCIQTGRCKTKTPLKQNTRPECKRIVFEYQKSLDLRIDLPLIAIVRIDLHFDAASRRAAPRREYPIEPSPPDLQVLHSVFLI